MIIAPAPAPRSGSLWCYHLSDSRLSHLHARSSLLSSLTVVAAGHQPVVVHYQQRKSLSTGNSKLAWVNIICIYDTLQRGPLNTSPCIYMSKLQTTKA
ncbi:hypothetical protein PIB30_061276 [Stylosanthes scabra]|uniref:Uncharacterized protein n=1 Tax=Stylosanthes scabra TaxID=79078 RepID=A0ABU6TN59_9FABA|nr:hypothetical protein [Stylosanthes scabra]